jgi:hypothetical protein
MIIKKTIVAAVAAAVMSTAAVPLIATQSQAGHYYGHGGYKPNIRYRKPDYVQPAPVYDLPDAHYDWCFRKFRSYHKPSNTFQPYNGPRRACISPWS